jgi:3-hydroxyisobutyrate dehydrogenase-like beta-hydroxyacid dehydrogenase
MSEAILVPPQHFRQDQRIIVVRLNVRMMNQIDLKQRKAVITGGAQGIGFSIASRLIASGATVSLWDRDEELLKKAREDLSIKGQVSLEIVDVTSAEGVELAAKSAVQKHGRIDILVIRCTAGATIGVLYGRGRFEVIAAGQLWSVSVGVHPKVKEQLSKRMEEAKKRFGLDNPPGTHSHD